MEIEKILTLEQKSLISTTKFLIIRKELFK